VAVPDQPVLITGQQEVIITFLEPLQTAKADMTQTEKRNILDNLVGLVPADLDEKAIKAERLARQ
jgi:hypothetical protein